MRSLIDLVLPPVCPGCGTEGELLCEECRGAVERRASEPAGAPLGVPFSVPEGVLQVEWCSAFAGPTRRALHALKYDSQRRLAKPLGAALAARWRSVGVGGEVLVPVPVHAARLRERGYDQAVLLARECGRELGLPVVEALRRRAETAAQHSLGRGERARNVRSAFEVDPRKAAMIRGSWVVLVDDVMTTGATLTGCARALEAARAAAVSALTVARER
jgi:ComF family protein